MPRPLRSLALRSLLGAALAATAGAGPVRAAPDQMSVETLKRAYLDCERRVAEGQVPTGEILWCSEVYETLKARAFDSDWQRLRAWTELNIAPGLSA